MSIAMNLQEIHNRITAAALRAGRDPDAVHLVAVSKLQSASAVDEASRAGQRLFGENYVQELTAKRLEVLEPADWHFIGALQTNKVKYLAGKVSMIHSVDRLSLAQEIDRQWGRIGASCEVLVQVNISQEETKSGTGVEDLLGLVRKMSLLPHLKVVGLMTMPPFFDDPEEARPYFRELKRLAGQIAKENIAGVEMRELSMGMSGDFEAAVEEGATLVRVGTAIFGSRG